MLILARAVGEEICIGNDIVVKVNKVSGRWVQIGIEAPKHVPILRGELRKKIPDAKKPLQ